MPPLPSGPLRYSRVLTRDSFEQLCEPVLQRVLEPIERVLAEAELPPSQVDALVLVGGSTRVPRVRALIEGLIGRPSHRGVDPELAVVTGVAVQGGVLGGAWPLTVSAIEVMTTAAKIHLD